MAQSLKPMALRAGDSIRVVSPSSPVQEDRLARGCEELVRLGFVPQTDGPNVLARESFFAGPSSARLCALKGALSEPLTRAVFCSRGGYGSNYLLDNLSVALTVPKIVLGYSDVTSLQVFLWQKFRWVTFYGPMIAAAFHMGPGEPDGYDRESFTRAVTETKYGWNLDLLGNPVVPGVAEGILLGGCLTLVQTAIGTPWELDTHGSILILEDCAMKPYQVDRALMHLKQAGKFRGVLGIILGDFPECEPPAGSESVEAIASRILAPLGIPLVWGAPIGHTKRPMLTVPLGVRARLSLDALSGSYTQLEILEPACVS